MDDFGLGFDDPADQAAQEREQAASAEHEDFGLGADEHQHHEAPAEEIPDITSAADQEVVGADLVKETPSPDEIPEKYVLDGKGDEFCAKVGTVAKELGMSQGKLQKIHDAIERSTQDECFKYVHKWIDQVKNDDEIGGSRFNESIATARRVFDHYAPSQELRHILKASGLSNHPDFIRMLVRIAKDVPQATEKRRSIYKSMMR